MAESNVREDFWSNVPQNNVLPQKNVLPQENISQGSHVVGTVYQFKGFWFTRAFLQGTQDALTHFKPLPTDVILTSYPKTGTTWLKAILYSILNRNSSSALTSSNPHELVPFLELQSYKPDFSSETNMIPAEAAVSFLGSSKTLLQSPDLSLDNDTTTGKRRIFSTHIPYQLFADHSIDSSDCKIVYVTRNPKDTLISMWHFVNKCKAKGRTMPWPLEFTVDKFCSGVTTYGPYYDHVLGYKKESYARPDKFFFTTYEELTSDTKGVVKSLAEFLGCPFDEEEGQILEEIVKNCSIDTLKSHDIDKSKEYMTGFPVPLNAFFRKGDVGDHKNYLTPEMIERLDAITREKFHGSGFMFGI